MMGSSARLGSTGQTSGLAPLVSCACRVDWLLTKRSDAPAGAIEIVRILKATFPIYRCLSRRGAAELNRWAGAINARLTAMLSEPVHTSQHPHTLPELHLALDKPYRACYTAITTAMVSVQNSHPTSSNTSHARIDYATASQTQTRDCHRGIS
jgi:hypothetical protein